MLVLGSFNKAQALVGAFLGHCETSLEFYYPQGVVLVFVAPGVAAGGAAPPAAGCCLLPLRSGRRCGAGEIFIIISQLLTSYDRVSCGIVSLVTSDHPAPGHQHNWYYEPLPSADPGTAANIQRRNNVTKLQCTLAAGFLFLRYVK